MNKKILNAMRGRCRSDGTGRGSFSTFSTRDCSRKRNLSARQLKIYNKTITCGNREFESL